MTPEDEELQEMMRAIVRAERRHRHDVQPQQLT